jgi:hypothetical protein
MSQLVAGNQDGLNLGLGPSQQPWMSNAAEGA